MLRCVGGEIYPIHSIKFQQIFILHPASADFIALRTALYPLVPTVEGVV